MTKKIRSLAVLCCCALLTLCACGKQKIDPGQIAEQYLDRAFSAQYTVTTHAGFYSEYRLDCRYENGVSRVTILQPESVAGICGILDGENAVLQYEDVSLDTLLPEVSGYAPVDVLHVLVTQLCNDQGASYGMEQDRVTVEYRTLLPDGTESLKLITLHPETLDLLAAECYLDGSLILTLYMETLNWDS